MKRGWAILTGWNTKPLQQSEPDSQSSSEASLAPPVVASPRREKEASEVKARTPPTTRKDGKRVEGRTTGAGIGLPTGPQSRGILSPGIHMVMVGTILGGGNGAMAMVARLRLTPPVTRLSEGAGGRRHRPMPPGLIQNDGSGLR